MPRTLWCALLVVTAYAQLEPIAGPASGGTVLTFALPPGCNASARCSFGPNAATSAATSLQHDDNIGSDSSLHVNASLWRCSVPSALESGAAVLAAGIELLDNATLTGGAIRHGDGRTVELTNTRSFDYIGTLIVEPPLSWTSPGSADVAVTFDLLVGRGTTGHGVSVSLAQLRSTAAYHDERGASGGLVVSFRTISGILVVQFRGEQLLERRLDGLSSHRCDEYNCAHCANSSRCTLAGCEWIDWQRTCVHPPEQLRRTHSFRTDSFVQVRLTVVDERLSLWHDGHEYASRVRIPGWEAMARASPWHLVFGARVSVRVDDHWVRDLSVVQGAGVGGAKTLVSFGDEACNPSALAFEYYASPIISRLDQLQGPVRGGTPVRVFGEHLARGSPHPVCRFGSHNVLASRGSDGTLECETPRIETAGTLPLEVSLNGVDFTSTAPATTFAFTDPVLLSVEPNMTISGSDPMLLTLFGLRLGGGANYLCRFDDAGNLSIVAAFFDAHRACVFCVAPSSNESNTTWTVGVEVALNGVDFTASNHIVTYHPTPRLESLSPSVGPSSGATRVLLSGDFDGRLGWACRFGWAQVAAAVVARNSSTVGHGAGALSCVSPSMLAAGALAQQPNLVTQLTFAPAEAPARRAAREAYYALHGAAYVRHGRLVLTNDAPDQTGSCILEYATLSSARPTSTSALSVAFDMHVTGVCQGGEASCGGAGISFSFGDLPDAAVGVYGAGDGLHVQLLTRSRLVVVSYAGSIVISADVHKDMRAHAPQKIELKYTANGLWLRYDTQLVVGGLRIDGWAPRPSWRFAFGAQTGTAASEHDEHSIDNVRIELGDIATQAGLVAVRVGVNGEQFSGAALMYTYLPLVRSTSISPASGPRDGGTTVTVTGAAMASGVDLRCSFNGTHVPASLRGPDVMVCVTPLSDGIGAVQAATAVNGVDFSADQLTFVYHEVSIVHALFPLSAPSQGGAIINVTGSSFADGTQPRCKFGVFGTMAASVQDARSMLCHTPAAVSMRTVPLEVALNAQQYTSDAHNFTTYSPPIVSSLSPSQGPVGGGTRVLIDGLRFDGGTRGTYACRFGEKRVEAVHVNGTFIECVTMLLPLGPHCVEVSLNGQDFTDSCSRFAAVPVKTLTSVSPTSGPVIGSTHVILRGIYLGDGLDYRCRFAAGGQAMWASATFLASSDNGGSVSCFSPLWPFSPGTHELSVTTNGQQYTPSLAYEAFASPFISFVSPSSGPVGGATTVHLFGTNLGDGSDYLCDFGGSLVPAYALSTTHVNCTAPASNAGGSRPLRLSLNGQQYTPGHAYGYFADLHLVPTSVSPSCGPSAGGTMVIVTSSASLAGGTHYQCSFGDAGRVPANFSDSYGTIGCVSPSSASPRGVQLFSVSLNGQQLTSSAASFTFTGRPAIYPPSPKSGPKSGGTVITLAGTHLHSGSHYLCRCEDVDVPASYDGGMNAVRCETPPSKNQCDEFGRCRARTGNTTCQLSLNGQQYTNLVAFGYHEAPHASASSPACGPVLGGTTVRVSGAGFANGTEHQCAFGGVRVVASVSLEDDGETITCTLPVLPSLHGVSLPLSLPLTITLNGQQFSTDLLSFSVFTPPHLIDIVPGLGPASGGTDVTIRGDNVTAGCDSRCAFDQTAIPCAHVGMSLLSRIPLPLEGGVFANQTLVRITLNGQQYSDALVFALHRPLQILGVSPSSGPVEGDTVIQLTGEHFADGPQLRCRIGSHLLSAHYVNESRIDCLSPMSSLASSEPPALFRLVASETESIDSECYTSLSAVDYFGHVSRTRAGHECQNWRSQHPHSHSDTERAHPGAGLGNHNFCRNPGGRQTGAWCYTTSPETRWALCDIGPPLASCQQRLLLFGNATTRGSALVLTAGHGQDGYAEVPIISLLPTGLLPTALAGLWVEFDLLVGALKAQPRDATGVPDILHSDGFSTVVSVHYGGPLESHDELGLVYLHPGLTVRLRTRGSVGQVIRPRLEVLVNGKVVHFVNPTALTFMGDSFRSMMVHLTAEHELTLKYDGITLVGSLLVDGLNPAADWRVRFAAKNGALADDVHAIDNLRALGLPAHRPSVVDVEVSLNRQDFTQNAITFGYRTSAMVSSCSPSTGPASGGTRVVLHGLGLQRGPDMRCRFDNAEVPASTDVGDVLVCVSPSMLPGAAAALQVTLNGQNFGAAAVTFAAYEMPRVSHLSLAFGPTAGGTVVTVHGSGACSSLSPAPQELRIQRPTRPKL